MSVPEGLCLISLGIEPRTPKLDQMKAQSRSMEAQFAVATMFFFLPSLEFSTAKQQYLTIIQISLSHLGRAYLGSSLRHLHSLFLCLHECVCACVYEGSYSL